MSPDGILRQFGRHLVARYRPGPGGPQWVTRGGAWGKGALSDTVDALGDVFQPAPVGVRRHHVADSEDEPRAMAVVGSCIDV